MKSKLQSPTKVEMPNTAKQQITEAQGSLKPQRKYSIIRYSKLQKEHKTSGRLSRLWSKLKQNRAEILLVCLLLAVSIAAHGWNMFDYPYIENDEATYTSRAWAFTSLGKLDVYTYRYDHAPLGWMIIGAWHLLSGGSHLFGSLIGNGRVLMLLVHAVSSLLLYSLTKRLTNGSKSAASIAVVWFSLSPLAIYFQRRILLDNLMVLWLLASLVIATRPRHRIKDYLLSGIIFGIAVLTKLNAVFFGPAYLYLIWRKAHKDHRIHAVLYWMFVAGTTIGSFFLYALLKQELLSAPIAGDGMPAHVSVVETFKVQLGRGDFAWPWESSGSFWQNVLSWMLKDKFILIFGAASALIGTVILFLKRKKYPLALTVYIAIWSYVAFLARGKIVLDLYIVPLIPFMAIGIGVMLNALHNEYLRTPIIKRQFALSVAIIFALVIAGLPTTAYTKNETSNQLNALAWIKQNVPKNAVITADNYVYPYLVSERGYQNVSYFFNTEYDPEVRKTYSDDWRNIDYLVLTHEIVKQIDIGTVPHIKDLLTHATLVADFREDSSSYIDLSKYISTNGDWAQVYRVKSRNDIVLQDSWSHFKSQFIVSYGQVVDKTNNELTTSYGQASAMVRAVEENDRPAFDGIWQWSKDHLRHRAKDVLLSWKWQKDTKGTYGLADSNNVCSADQTIAYALFKAHEKWPNSTYNTEAATHTNDWWKNCVFTAGGMYAVDSSADGSRDNRLINTGYFDPQLYRYLAKNNNIHPWETLIQNQYQLYERLVETTGTLPDWAIVTVAGQLAPATPLLGAQADKFGYDSLSAVYNIALDNAVNQNNYSTVLISKLNSAVTDFAKSSNSPPAYSTALVVQQSSSNSTTLNIQSDYEKYIYATYDAKTGKWADGFNYLDHFWYWRWHQAQKHIKPLKQVEIQ